MRKPNFFIIGAPKCGTTSLALYLGDHPRIFFAASKELHFFNTDMAYRVEHSEPKYYAQFREAGSGHIAVGEGSVFYLFSEAAVPNILKSIPDAKFIVMVRNPIDMAVALHAEYRASGDENIPDFASAWRMQEARKSGMGLPAFCRDSSRLLYGKICSTGWQIKRLYSRVGRDRVLVLLLDDLKRDARAVYLRTLEFLGVPDDRRTEFALYNQRKQPIRSYLVQRAIQGSTVLKRKWRIKRRFGVLPLIQRFNLAESQQEVFEPQFRSELANYFRKDVEELSALVGRDLSAWLLV